MLQLDNQLFLYSLVLIPGFVFIYWLTNRWRKKALSAYGELAIIKQLFPTVSTAKRNWKFILFVSAFLFLIIAIVNPQVGSKLQDVKRTGADIMICLDVSNSMKAEDLQPNRLEKAKQSITKLIDKLKGDRIGIIVFGGQAYVQLPITTDYSASKLFLETINTDMIPTQGTDIGAAINLALESFGKDEGKNKAIIIITDGENHESNAIGAAEKANEKGITIHTVGMGSVDGSPIPIYKNNKREGFRKDKEGNTIVTKLNENTLKEIAAAGNGIFVRANNSGSGLNYLIEEIDKLEKKEFESKMYSDYEDRFQMFTAIALLLLLIDAFLTERKSKLYEKLNLFNDKK